jgi:hypothetical protein
MGRTTALRRELKQRVFSYAESRGFIRDESESPRVIHFRRFTAEKVEVFSISWDKYGHARFNIRFNEAPIHGVIVRGIHIPAARIHPQDPSFALALLRKRGPYLRHWWQLKMPLLERMKTWKCQYTPKQVVDSVLMAYEEMEDWWKSGVIGPHVYAPLDAEGGYRLAERSPKLQANDKVDA